MPRLALMRAGNRNGFVSPMRAVSCGGTTSCRKPGHAPRRRSRPSRMCRESWSRSKGWAKDGWPFVRTPGSGQSGPEPIAGFIDCRRRNGNAPLCASVVVVGPALARDGWTFQRLQGVAEELIQGSWQIGTVPASDKLTATFRIRNVGDAAVTLTTLRIAGTGFFLTGAPSLPHSVNAGTNVDFTIEFRPLDSGSYSGNLLVNATGYVIRGASSAALGVFRNGAGLIRGMPSIWPCAGRWKELSRASNCGIRRAKRAAFPKRLSAAERSFSRTARPRLICSPANPSSFPCDSGRFRRPCSGKTCHRQPYVFSHGNGV